MEIMEIMDNIRLDSVQMYTILTEQGQQTISLPNFDVIENYTLLYDSVYCMTSKVVILYDGQLTHIGMATEINGIYYPNCKVVSCQISGVKMFIHSSECVEIDGEYYHYSEVFTCPECGEHYIDSQDFHSVNGNQICDNCYANYISCDNCGDMFHETEHHITDINGNDICEYCSRSYSFCDVCNEYVHESDFDYDHDCCDQCAPVSIIREYSYKPKPVFYGRYDLHMGIEIEVISKNAEISANLVAKKNVADFLYFKHDSSLNYGGYEIVSHPFTFEWIKANPINLAECNCYSKSDDSTGIHIHISRKALSNTDIAKMLFFFADNREFIAKIAGRDYNHFCKAMSKNGCVKKAQQGHYDRYEAINLCNKSTVEIRVFKGNAGKTAIMRNIEFVHSLIMYIKETNASKLSHIGYSAFISNKKEYNNINKYIKKCA